MEEEQKLQLSEHIPSVSRSISELECGCKPRILIVDDISFNILAVVVMIKDFFHMTVDEELDGHLGVKKYKEGLDKPCGCVNRAHKLIFMDLSMPTMGGMEAS